ncbi:helix-turn-helix domain-containing protein [Bacillus paranthracis]
MNFSTQIKRIRIEQNLTQEQFSKKLNVSRQTISSWENNRNLPDLEMVVTIAKMFNISLDQLILGDLTMTEKLIQDGNLVRKAKLNLISAILFILGGICFIASMFTESTVQPDGMLYEPYFFLIPIGYLLFFISIILFSISALRKLFKKQKKR